MEAVNATIHEKDGEIKKLLAQVKHLKKELAMHDALSGRNNVSYGPFSPEARSQMKARLLAYCEGDGPEPEMNSLRQIRENYALFRQLYQQQAAATKCISVETVCPRCAGGLSMSAETDLAMPPVEIIDMVGTLAEDGGGQGFGVGVAPPGAKPESLALPNMVAAVKRLGTPDVAAAPLPAVPIDSAEASSTAASAFEEFKKTAGMDKHALLLENKRALRESKASVRTLGAQVNAAKRQIDETKARLDRLRGPRAAASPARGAAEVIGEEEFQLLEALREAKQRYRDAFSRMTDERDKSDYVAQTVENCRAQLLTDFGSFLKAERPDAAASADALLAAVSAGMRE